jgi:hypothetical protein
MPLADCSAYLAATPPVKGQDIRKQRHKAYAKKVSADLLKTMAAEGEDLKPEAVVSFLLRHAHKV